MKQTETCSGRGFDSRRLHHKEIMQVKWKPTYGKLFKFEGPEEIRTIGEKKTILAFCPITFEAVPVSYVFSEYGTGYAWVREFPYDGADQVSTG